LDQGFDLLVKKEEPRTYQNYFNSPDANGKFIIQNFDDASFRFLNNPIVVDTTTNRASLSQEDVQDRRQLGQLVEEINEKEAERALRDQFIASEYVLAYFTLATDQPVNGGDVYIFGELSDWRIEDAYRMKYNSQDRQYETEVMLKQGYYNYMYAFQKTDDIDTQKFTFAEVEGNWFETDNDYHILIYYRPFGKRYDQLIGSRSFNRFGR